MHVTDDLSDWIYVCWVLRKQPEFDDLTTQVVRVAPFPEGVATLPALITGKFITAGTSCHVLV